jgi:hypothetical protein
LIRLGDAFAAGDGGGDGDTINYINNSTVNINSGSTLNVDNTSTISVAGNTVHTPPAVVNWTADQTNLDIGLATRIRVTANAHGIRLNSLVAVAGRVVCLHNVGDKVILLTNEHGPSTAANRIRTSTGNDFWFAPNHEVTLWCDPTTNRWRVSENSDERLGGTATYTLTADTADFALERDKRQHEITPSAEGWSITGFAGGHRGLRQTIINGSTADGFTLEHNDVTSSAVNRLFLPAGEPVRIPPNSSFDIEWNYETERWHLCHVKPMLGVTQIGYGSSLGTMTGSADLTRLDEGVIGLRRLVGSSTTAPGLETTHRRTASANSQTGDLIGYWIANARISGDRPMGKIEWLYTGAGSQDGGEFRLSTVDSLSAYNLGFKVNNNADFFFGRANTATRLLGTGSSSEVVNITLGIGLSRSGTTLNATAYDLISTLTAAEISVTSNTTATISRMHVLDGSGCTLTLPAVSGNTGKLLGIRIATTATGLMTIDGNSTELIDGEQTRIMWAGESAILLCDGSRWAKIAGKTIPMIGKASNNKSLGSFDSIAHATVTVVPLDSTETDNTGLMVDLANDRITCRRTNRYQTAGFVQFCGTASFGGLTATGTRFFSSFPGAQPEIPAVSGSVPAVGSSTSYPLTAGSHYQLTAYQDTGATQYIAAGVSNLSLVEIPSW